jgi:hypothetical protein
VDIAFARRQARSARHGEGANRFSDENASREDPRANRESDEKGAILGANPGAGRRLDRPFRSEFRKLLAHSVEIYAFLTSLRQASLDYAASGRALRRSASAPHDD